MKELVQPTKEELMQAFGVKTNPVVSFWFIPSYCISMNIAEYPEDFDYYKLYKKTLVKDCMWSCYCKKETRGLVSKSYWQVQ